MIIIKRNPKQRFEYQPDKNQVTDFWYWFTDQNSKYPNDMIVRRCWFCGVMFLIRSKFKYDSLNYFCDHVVSCYYKRKNMEKIIWKK